MTDRRTHSAIDMRAQPVLVDAGDLFRKEGIVSEIVIDARNPQQYDLEFSAPLPQ